MNPLAHSSYAIEHQGKLYVGYSNSGDKSTRVGTGRDLWNNNSAELADPLSPPALIRSPTVSRDPAKKANA